MSYGYSTVRFKCEETSSWKGAAKDIKVLEPLEEML
jgi:hypothetical protein